MKIFSVLVIMMFSLTTFSLMAQKARLEGTVRDRADKELLTGVSVKVMETGAIVYTDYDGKFSIPELTPGIYTLTINLISYDTIKMTTVNVDANNPSLLDITLQKKDAAFSSDPVTSAVRTSINADAGIETL